MASVATTVWIIVVVFVVRIVVVKFLISISTNSPRDLRTTYPLGLYFAALFTYTVSSPEYVTGAAGLGVTVVFKIVSVSISDAITNLIETLIT